MQNILNTVNAITEVGSPYFSFYLLHALYKTGMYDEALQYIRSWWGRMLDAGATTWWEAWTDSDSLCHGWSAGPTYDLMAKFAGIEPLQAGFKTTSVAPHPAGLSSASARVPTPAGSITAGWTLSDSEFAVDVDVPPAMLVRVSIPRIRPDWTYVAQNGHPISTPATSPNNSVDLETPGKYRIVISRP